jgi:hypothetical protein
MPSMSKSSLKKAMRSHTPELEGENSLISAPILSEYRIGMELLQNPGCCKPHVGWAATKFYLNPICVASFVFAKLLPTAKATRTKVDAVPYYTQWIGTLDSDRVGKVGQTTVTFGLYARFIDCCRV